MGIHHPNLATIVGYCDDGTNQGLICEFVPNQSLERHLSGNRSVLTSILLEILEIHCQKTREGNKFQ